MSTVQKPINPNRVAIYIRWSTDDQSDGTTLEVQLDGCRHYLLSQGWQVNESLTFVDNGYSGGNLNRPGLDKLRKQIRQGQVDCLVVFKVDRLSRSVMDTVNLVLDEWEGRTYLKSAREPIDTTNAMGKQFFYMLVSYAEWERSVIRERTMAGRRKRAQEGYKPSAIAPYGYRHSPTKTGALEIVVEEAAVVKRIFERYNAGEGAKTVVNTLNREGISFRSGSPWNERTILYLLSNRVYVGDMVYGRLTRNPRRGKEEGEVFWSRNDDPLVVEGSAFLPPIVTRQQFDLAQETKLQRTTAPGRPSGRSIASPYLLTGIAKCTCGYSLFGSVITAKTGKSYAYYGCIGKKIRGTTTCQAGKLPQEQLDAEVESKIKEEFGTRLARSAYVDRLTAAHQQHLHTVGLEFGQVEKQLRELGEQAKKVRRDYREDLLTVHEFRALTKEIEAETELAQQRLATLEQTRQKLSGEAVNVQMMAASFEQLDRWDTLKVVERKKLLRYFVRSLTVYRDLVAGTVDLQLEWVTSKSTQVV